MDTPPHDRQQLATASSQAVCASKKWGGLYLIAAFGTLVIAGITAPINAHAQTSNGDTIPTGIDIIPTDLPAHASTVSQPNQPVSLLPGTIPASVTLKEDLEIPSLATQYHQTLTGNAPIRRQQRPTSVQKAQSTGKDAPEQPRPSEGKTPSSSELIATKTDMSHSVNTASRSENAAASANSNAYLIQLGAFRDTISAETYWASFRIRYPELAQTHQKTIVSADLGTKGIYHRLQLVGFITPDQAEQKCRQLKADGTDCFATQH
ncbi:SPOR domain-containing protein [Thalassospira lucentensis]|uniref:SPOR domain-containing protein n=1 Tax=Thalassospira lucentensis TaxID=168935 RepID=UPI003D2EED8F